MKKIYSLLCILHAFVGVGALFGGGGAIINPECALGASADILKNSPFSNFLIPGIILFTVIGLGNVITAILFRYKLRYQGYISSIFSWALIIWIIVQCIMLNSVNILHVIYFIIGLIEAILSIIILFKKRLFPTNIVLNFYRKINKEQ
ncbi:hypothetical protein [Oceanirhabdus sp. W0125-5]|uniref:hypothetical protein n=1 Tax=Oceanirhabdus sp. W0125-5 TaxID=2999116 RepID=UPI0022F2F709|nr:hypothetical protein [Oceanirhabdus sp. W0125-5]WBW96370.1 hypothetical protein OW730_22140 [Oceanirhabdus sp. W0125-5]